MLLSAFAGPGMALFRRRISRRKGGHLPTPDRPQMLRLAPFFIATFLTLKSLRRKGAETSFAWLFRIVPRLSPLPDTYVSKPCVPILC